MWEHKCNSKKVFNNLGIHYDYVWGHVNFGTEENLKYFGHRWNAVTIGNKQYMVDFTMGILIHNIDKEGYFEYATYLLDKNNIDNEYRFICYDKLSTRVTIGGFKKKENGVTIDDIDSFGRLNNITNNPSEIYQNLESLNPEVINQYLGRIKPKKAL